MCALEAWQYSKEEDECTGIALLHTLLSTCIKGIMEIDKGKDTVHLSHPL